MSTATTKLSTLAKRVRCSFKWGARLDWDKQDVWQREANGYWVTLRYRGRRYSFDYWQGVGITEDPSAAGCLESLLLEASSTDQPFEDWCGDLGENTDSRKAEATWNACRRERLNLERLLGDDFDAFMDAEV